MAHEGDFFTYLLNRTPVQRARGTDRGSQAHVPTQHRARADLDILPSFVHAALKAFRAFKACWPCVCLKQELHSVQSVYSAHKGAYALNCSQHVPHKAAHTCTGGGACRWLAVHLFEGKFCKAMRLYALQSNRIVRTLKSNK